MAHDATTPVINQQSFRGRDDSQGLNSTTFTYALNADWTQDTDTAFRIRYLIQETAGGATGNTQYSLQYNLDGGGWTNVTLTSAVQIELSGQYADQDATTQVLGSGSFVAGDGVEDPSTSSGNINLTSEETEVEFCLTIDSAQVSDGQTVDVRCQGDGADLDAYTNTPTITINEPAAGGEDEVYAIQ